MKSSLSEFGCVESTRKFGEVSTLYSEKMTPVYSGGLVYEYTEEGDKEQQKYGLVRVDSKSSVTEKPDFNALKTALAAAKPPTGDGGYKENGSPSECPSRSDTWLVDNDGLPAMPPKAAKFFENGAGKGVGLEGAGSQEVGAESTGIAKPGSGAVTGTRSPGASSTGDSDSAAVSVMKAPAMFSASLVCGFVVVVSSFLGGAVLL